MYWKAAAVIARKNGSIFLTFSFHCLTLTSSFSYSSKRLYWYVFCCPCCFFIIVYLSMKKLKLFGDFEINCVYWLQGCAGSCWSFDVCFRVLFFWRGDFRFSLWIMFTGFDILFWFNYCFGNFFGMICLFLLLDLSELCLL